MALEVMARDAGAIPLDLAFRVEPGDLLALVGPSGAGKTTLLRAIAGLYRPAEARVVAGGTIWLDTKAGVALPPDRRRVGVVFQSYALFPHLTAAQNVACAMGDLPRAERRPEALRLLNLVDLGGLADRRPVALSGGQQQRVAIARALARRPQALLLDEPFSAVDRGTRELLHAQILTLRAHLAMPVVLVTHDLTEAQALADRMVVIDKGRMVAEGPTAAVLSNPAALRAVGLREAAAMLRATVLRHHPDGMSELTTATGTLWLPRVDAPPGTALRVRIMAHDVILSRARPEGLSAQTILPVRIIDQRRGEGPAVMVRLAVGPDQLLARITRRAADQLALQPGEPAHAIVKAMSVARDHIARDTAC